MLNQWQLINYVTKETLGKHMTKLFNMSQQGIIIITYVKTLSYDERI